MKRTIILAATALLCATAFAQQSLWGGQPIVSPEIHTDNTVTFRLLAPDCTAVKVTGDFLPPQTIETPDGSYDVPGVADMTRGNGGLWEFTTAAPLAPELYNYNFYIDGVRVTDPANVYTVRDVANVMSVFIIGGDRADMYKVNAVPHGTVARTWYPSGLGFNRRMSVYTPAGYESSDAAYPVFYLLHGMGGDEEAWLALGRAAQILDNLIAEGKAEPMIVVMTNGNVNQEAAPGEAAEGFTVPVADRTQAMDGTFETYFPEVVNYVDSHYRTVADKRHRAIAGLSMGGFHSLHISKYYPDMFDYVGLFSAAILPRDEVHSPVYDDTEGKLKVQFEKNPALYWIAIGNTDFLYENNAEFRRLLDKNGWPYTYYETGGGHIWRNWRIYLSEFVPLLFK